jgi:DNA polymerase-3 subunit alpha
MVGRRALESLIKVGALDCFAERLQLANEETIDNILKRSAAIHRAAEVGQLSLFGEVTGVQFDQDNASLLAEPLQVSRRELLQWERDLMGVYVSEHPLQGVMDKLHRLVNVYSTQITEADHDRQVTMIGIVKHIRRHTTKDGKPMAFAGIEDLYGEMEVVVWPRTWDETHELWKPDHILLLRGRLDASRAEPKLLCDEATTNLEVYEPAEPEARPASARTSEPLASDNGAGYDELSQSWEEPEPEEYAAPISEVPAPPAEPLPPAVAAAEPVLVKEAEPVQLYESPIPDPVPAQIEMRPQHLLVHIKRCADPDRDKRKLQRVHGLLISYHGQDHFALILEDNVRRVQIDFPNDTTHYCPELVSTLAEILGPDAIQVLPDQA